MKKEQVLNPEITLVKFNDRGRQNIEQIPELIAHIERSVKRAGGKFVDAYLTQGEYDAVVVTNMPEPATSIAVWAQVNKQGWVTQTLPGIHYSEAPQVLQNSQQFAPQHA